MAGYNVNAVCCSLVFLFFSDVAAAHQFDVGGRDGWVLRPSESYGHWAERLRFQVNDTLRFRYNKAWDCVLVVTQNDYHQCNTAKPLEKMDGGDSIFRFDRSGPFFFITGNKSNCGNGQKLVIVVLAVRSPPPSSTTASSPSPALAPALSPEESGGSGVGGPSHSAAAAAAGGSLVAAVVAVGIAVWGNLF